MERVYVPEFGPASPRAELPPEKARYLLRVHRLKDGDVVAVFDGLSCESLARIEVKGKRAALRFERVLRREEALPMRLMLAQALPKHGKMETIVQKAVELGVSGFRPFVSTRSVSRVDKTAAANKVRRWRLVAEEACRQCRRIRIPEIGEIAGFEDMLAAGETGERIWLAYEGEGTLGLSEALHEPRPDALCVVVGPEGGFEEEEVALAKERGALPISLGPRILRTETAGPALLAILQFTWGDLGKPMSGQRPEEEKWT